METKETLKKRNQMFKMWKNKIIMNETKHFLKDWGIISLAAFVLNYLLWWLAMDDETLPDCPYDWEDFILDLCYCALYVLVSLSVSNIIRKLLLDSRLRDKQLFGKEHPSFTLFFLHSGAMLVTNIIIAIGFESVVNEIYKTSEDFFCDRIYVFTTIATLLTIVYLSLYYSRIVVQQGNRNVEMQKELLKLQLDPHFVFNCLSTLAELISEDPELAETFTLKFSTIYRYIVNQLNKETVAIAEEIHFIREYCDLLNIRHPQHFVFQIEEELQHDGHLILPMAIQILVENAVKHNSHSTRKPLHVSIYRDGEYIVVRNHRIPLKGTLPSTTKLGLKNLDERYSLLGLHPVVSETEEEFEVKIPIIKK